MNRTQWEEKFLDYLDGQLSKDERSAFEAALLEDSALKASFAAYQRVIAAEKLLAAEEAALDPRFAANVMRQVDTVAERSLRGLWHQFGRQRALWGALAAAAAAVLVLKIGMDLPEEMIGRQRVSEMVAAKAPAKLPAAAEDRAQLPASEAAKRQESTSDQIGEAAPLEDGLEKVTIDTDATATVEGWAEKKERVDVYVQKDASVAGVTQNAQVLSVERRVGDGQTGGGLAPSRIELLIPKEDTGKIRSAQQSGTLVLSLRGKDEGAQAADPPSKGASFAKEQTKPAPAAPAVRGAAPERKRKAGPPDGQAYVPAEQSRSFEPQAPLSQTEGRLSNRPAVSLNTLTIEAVMAVKDLHRLLPGAVVGLKLAGGGVITDRAKLVAASVGRVDAARRTAAVRAAVQVPASALEQVEAAKGGGALVVFFSD